MPCLRIQPPCSYYCRATFGRLPCAWRPFVDKLSGLVIDIGDDYNGAVLRSIFPTAESVPDFVKNASHHTPEAREAFPDDLFALVMVDGDVTLRKFACVDKGNTALSMAYFAKTAHLLPEEAAKVAAGNLITAAGWYDIEPPEQLKKIALGLGTAVQLGLMGPQAVKTTKSGIERNMETARQSGGAINPQVLGGAHAPTVG